MDQPVAAPSNKRSSSKRSSRGSKKGSKRGSKKGSKKGSRRSMPQRQKISYRSKAIEWLEPRLLFITTGVTLLGVVLQVIAISTDSWIIINTPGVTAANTAGKYLVEMYTGLWRFCTVEISRSVDRNGTVMDEKISMCERHNLFHTEKEVIESKDIDEHHLDTDVKHMVKTDHTRTAIAFTIIALVIMTIGHAFAFYALKRPRYIIKRLAALLHFMTAASILVLNEVFAKTVEHETEVYSGGTLASSHFGYSFVLSWLVFVFFLLAGIIFLFMSQKKKAEHADCVEAVEDEPVEIFRR